LFKQTLVDQKTRPGKTWILPSLACVIDLIKAVEVAL